VIDDPFRARCCDFCDYFFFFKKKGGAVLYSYYACTGVGTKKSENLWWQNREDGDDRCGGG